MNAKQVAIQRLCRLAGRLPVPAIEFLQTTARTFQDDEDGTAPLPWPFCRGGMALRVEADRVLVHPGRGVEMRVRYRLGSVLFALDYRRDAKGEWLSHREGRRLSGGLQWQLESVYLDALEGVDKEAVR